MKKADAALILVIIAAAGALFLLRGAGGHADVARVYLDGECVWECALDSEGTFETEGVLVTVSGGSARIAASDCPDALCVARGDISRAGESAVCLPNRLSLVLEGGNSPDAVVY